jgi:co-chaperonin GroES (HSP10)
LAPGATWSAASSGSSTPAGRALNIERVPFAPTGDDLMVFRLEPTEQKTDGGLVIPNQVMHNDAEKRASPSFEKRTISVGYVLAAGCGARDWMRSHGVLVGDMIRWGKFSGEERAFTGFSGGRVRNLTDVLLLNVRDVRGSFDLDVRLAEGMMRIVFVSDPAGNGMHIVKPTVKE